MGCNYQHYALNVEKDEDGGYIITSPDVPGVVTQCDHEDDIHSAARDAFITMFNYMIKDREEIPAASESGNKKYFVDLSTEQAMKIANYNAMISRNETFSGLAKKMNKDPKEIRRAFNLKTTTKTEMLEKMLDILKCKHQITFTLSA